jgi:hypothetical protein
MTLLSKVLRTASVLGVVVATGALRTGSAAAGGADQLFTRQPDRLLVESGQRVSDGRKLQKDGDSSFRRAEGGARGEAAVEVAGQAGDGSSRTGAASSVESKASTGGGADR